MYQILNETTRTGEGTAWEINEDFSREALACAHEEALIAYTVVAKAANGSVVPWDPAAADDAPEKTVYGVLRGNYVPKTDADGDVVARKVVVQARFAIVLKDCLAFPAGANAAGTAANLAAAIAGLSARNILVR